MVTIFYILAKCVRILLDIISLAMIMRMLLPLFTEAEESPLYMMSLAITEPLVMPMRLILDKFGVGQNTPIDMGFMATYLSLFIIDMFLPAI